MTENKTAKKFLIKDILSNVLSDKSSIFLSTYTGIERSQLISLNKLQQEKVFLGLWKQLDLATSLHGNEAKSTLVQEAGNYFSNAEIKIKDLIPIVNSLLVFGDIRNIEGTGVEHLHDRLAHFWRILGWEELQQIGACDNTKNHAGSIEPIVTSCGNLIRTLDLLSERWDESGEGPRLIFPLMNQKISKEESDGYRASRMQTNYTNTLSVITGRNSDLPTKSTRADFKEKGMLLDKLLLRYPIEFAFAIFEYYSFLQNWNEKSLNIGIVQEYVSDGKRRIKGIINGKMVVLHGEINGSTQLLTQQIITSSMNDIVTGSPLHSNFTTFDLPVSDGDAITLIQGDTAAAIIGYPDLIQTFNVRPGDIKKKISSFSASIRTSNQDKPILTLQTGQVVEQKHVAINNEVLQEVKEKTLIHLRENSINNINIEAGHIHADTTATNRQKNGIIIGTDIASYLQENGINVIRSTMIDEDHVPNVLKHEEYLKLMRQLGFNLDEVIFESSPAIREISISAISTLLSRYPEHFEHAGDALIFNIPDTDLKVEVVKDINAEPFELGCVAFDVGLTLYKIYPELGLAYQNLNGKDVHSGMLEIYKETEDIHERLALVRRVFPYLTTNASEIEKTSQLPSLENKGAAIINVLEGFYTPQQQKLEGILRALQIPISLIDVTFSNQGLKVNLD